MNLENILLEIQESTAIVTINRPQSLNALNKATISELSNTLDDLADDAKVRVILLTGSGSKAFVAGADIKEFKDFDANLGEKLAQEGQQKLFDKIEQMPKPVIAAVNGFALGGGLELAMACHFRIASENAKMGLPEVTLGLIPGYGGTQRLPQLIGKGRAMQAILSAEMFTAEQALEIGLVNEVVPQAELLNRCTEIAQKISKNASTAIASAIEAINAAGKENGYATEIKLFGELFDTENFREGTSAFLEKRKPNFT